MISRRSRALVILTVTFYLDRNDPRTFTTIMAEFGQALVLAPAGSSEKDMATVYLLVLQVQLE